MADPNLIRAMGTAILAFGILLLFLKVTYFVSRNVGTVIEQWRVIVPVHTSGHALSDFSEVSVISEAARSADDNSTTYRLCLVGPAHKLCLASSRYRDVLTADRKLVEGATGIGS